MSEKSRSNYRIPICLEGCQCQQCRREKEEAEKESYKDKGKDI